MAQTVGKLKSRVIQDGNRHKTGVEVWWAKHSDTKSLRGTLYGRKFPNESGEDAPYCYQVDIDFGFYNKSRAKVTAYYRTRRQPNTARVSIINRSTTKNVTEDLDGKTIVGPYLNNKDNPYGHGLNFYRVVEGSNIYQEGQAFVKIETSFPRTGFSAQEIGRLMGLIGKVNSTDLPNFGQFPQGTLKLESSPLTQQWEESGLWYLDLVFAVSPVFPDPWNKWTKKQLRTKVVRRGLVLDADGNTIGDSGRDVEIEVKRRIKLGGGGGIVLETNDSPIEDTRLFEEADFQDIDRIILWEGQ